MRRGAKLRHHSRRHQRRLVDHLARRAEIAHRCTYRLHVPGRSSIQEVDVARCTNHSMNAHGVTADEHEIDMALVEAHDEIDEVRREAIVGLTTSRFAHRPDLGFARTSLRCGPAKAIRYACFETCATEASRLAFERPGCGSSPSSCRRT